MRILFIGDVIGRPGRDAVAAHLPDLKMMLAPDVTILNGENSAHGFGITGKICEEFYGMGVDVITTGNHIWDQREIIPYIDRDKKLLRPMNFPEKTPGQGSYIHQLEDGRRIMVVNMMGRLFMDALDDPFAIIEKTLSTQAMGRTVQAIFVDFHAEATSEKMAYGQYLDGRVSCVVGTHTHIPTADAQVLPKGTAYQTDAGMTGDYDSVIGMQKDVPLHRFTRKTPSEKMFPAPGDATVCGIFVVTDDKTGLAKSIEPVRIGGRLKQSIPA